MQPNQPWPDRYQQLIADGVPDYVLGAIEHMECSGELAKLPTLHESYAHLHYLPISHSSMTTFNSCERKLEFRKFHGSQRSDDSQAASLGRALHEAMLSYMQTGDLQSAIWTLWELYPYQYYTSPLHERSMESAIAMLLELTQFDRLPHLELAQFKTQTGELRPAHEVKFAITFTNQPLGRNPATGLPVPVVYIGFIDAVFHDIVNRRFVVIDLKTTTRQLADYTPAYQFDTQCIPYAFVLNQILPEPLEQLDVMYLVAKLSLLEPKILPYQFTKTQTEIREWARTLQLDFERLQIAAVSGWFPRRSSACIAFNRPCHYFDVCQTRDPKVIRQLMRLEAETPGTDARIDEAPWITLQLELQ